MNEAALFGKERSPAVKLATAPGVRMTPLGDKLSKDALVPATGTTVGSQVVIVFKSLVTVATQLSEGSVKVR